MKKLQSWATRASEFSLSFFSKSYLDRADLTVTCVQLLAVLS